MRNLICGFLVTGLIHFSALGVQRKEGVELSDTSHRQLEELHVTAIKGQNHLSSSTPLQILDSEKILTTGITDIGNAMRHMAGVNLRDYGGAGGLKTVSIRGLGAQHTGVIYDGAPLSDMQTGQIDLSRYSLENINSIGIIIGDSDDIFNVARIVSSAANITVNSFYAPDLLSPLPHLTAKMRFASFSTYNPYVRFEKGNGKNIAFSAVADFLHSLNNYPFYIYNGDETTREKRKNSQINSGHLEGNLIWKPFHDQSFRFKAYYYDNGRHLPGPVVFYAVQSNERLRERNAFAQLDYTGRLSPKFSLKGIAKYNWSSSCYRDTNGKYPGGELENYYIQNEKYIAASLLYSPLQNLRLSYSADYFHNYLTSNDTDNRHPSRNSFLQAMSANYVIQRFNLTARLLWTMVSDITQTDTHRFSSKFSPSASMTVRVLENVDWRLRFSYKNIFRIPTFNELYFIHYGTVNLDPEITDQINVGTTYALPASGIIDALEISADGYLNHVRNKIVAIPYNMFLWTMTNLGKVRSTGLDVTLSSDFKINAGQHLLLNGNYSYQRSVSRTNRSYPDWNKLLPYIPLNSGAWSLTWINPWVNVAIHSSGCSSRFSTTTNTADTRMSGYMEFGVSIFRDFKFKASTYQIKADVINAFNKQYEIVRRYPMPGRSFSITIGFNLN